MHQNISRLLTFLVTVLPLLAAQAAPYPLDSLSADELQVVQQVLESEGKTDKSSRFSLVHLAPPEKQAVLAGDENLPRLAFASIRHEREMYEAIIDVDAASLVSWEKIENVQPAFLDSEWVMSQQIVRKDEGFQAALARRGLEGRRAVFCFPAFPGNFDRPMDEGNQRLGMVGCYATGEKGMAHCWKRWIGVGECQSQH